MDNRLAFSTLAIGSVFEFYGHVDHPGAGFERGPWKKTGPSTYCKVSDPEFKCTVGTRKVKVYEVNR